MNLNRIEAHAGRTKKMLHRHGRKSGEETRPTGWRLRESDLKYIDGCARDEGVPKTRIIEDALDVHRTIGKGLTPHKLRLQQFALDEGMDWETQKYEVLVKAALRWLDQHEKQRK